MWNSAQHPWMSGSFTCLSHIIKSFQLWIWVFLSNSPSGQRSAGIFLTSGYCCVLLAETVWPAVASSPPADQPSPANQRAKAPAGFATPPWLRANQWVYFISNLVCLCFTLPMTNALNYQLLNLVLFVCDSLDVLPQRPASQTLRRTCRPGRLTFSSCPVIPNRCAMPTRGQRWEVETQESLKALPPTTPLTQPYATSHRSQ